MINEEILKKYLTPNIECKCPEMIVGQRVGFIPMVKESLKEYYFENKNNIKANQTWLKIGEILVADNNWFSLLYVSDGKGFYLKGTAVIEIGYNEDIEIRGDAIFPLINLIEPISVIN